MEVLSWCTSMYGSHTGTVHLVYFSEKISQGLALRLPSEWVPKKPELTPASFGRGNTNFIRLRRSYKIITSLTIATDSFIVKNR